MPTVRAVVVEHEEHGCIHPWTGSVVPGTYVVPGPALYVDVLLVRSKWCSSSVVDPTLPMLCPNTPNAARRACATLVLLCLAVPLSSWPLNWEEWTVFVIGF